MDVEVLSKVEFPERARLIAAARDYLVATGDCRSVIEDDVLDGVSIVMILRRKEKVSDHPSDEDLPRTPLAGVDL